MDVDQINLHDLDLLGLGEALHGPDDFLTLRNDLFRHLVREHGFTTLAIESSFPHSRLVNDYVNHNGAAAWSNGLSHGYGQIEGNREIIDWMREENRTRNVKLQFFGFDIPGLTGHPASPRYTLAHIADLAPYEALLGPDKRWEKSEVPLADLTALRDALEQLAPPDPEGLHYAHLARQHVDFFLALARGPGWAGSLRVRDLMMADNLRYILQQSPGKVLAFAHNVHLQKGEASMPLGDELASWAAAGTHLHERHRYAVIGTGVQEAPQHGVDKAEPGTFEALHPGWQQAVNRDLPTRSASATNPTYQPLYPQTLTNYDWLEVLACVS